MDFTLNVKAGGSFKPNYTVVSDKTGDVWIQINEPLPIKKDKDTCLWSQHGLSQELCMSWNCLFWAKVLWTKLKSLLVFKVQIPLLLEECNFKVSFKIVLFECLYGGFPFTGFNYLHKLHGTTITCAKLIPVLDMRHLIPRNAFGNATCRNAQFESNPAVQKGVTNGFAASV